MNWPGLILAYVFGIVTTVGVLFAYNWWRKDTSREALLQLLLQQLRKAFVWIAGLKREWIWRRVTINDIVKVQKTITAYVESGSDLQNIKLPPDRYIVTGRKSLGKRRFISVRDAQRKECLIDLNSEGWKHVDA